MADRLLIRDCRLPDAPEGERTDILIEGTQIAAVGPCRESSVRVVDAGGRIAAPGFIELHIQGAGGADILDGTQDALRVMSQTLARLGTTGFLGTTVYRGGTDNGHLRVARRCTGADLGGAVLLGIHLEGPFIEPARKGGIALDSILPPSRDVLEAIVHATEGTLRMMTIAPELPGNHAIIRGLVDRGIVAAFAHSSADYDGLRAGFDAGITHVTHIFNAMAGLHHRDPGPLAAIFEHPSVTAQIISDGRHLHPAAVRLVWRLLGPDRCACITDGVQGMGLPDGRYRYNGREYLAADGAARYTDGTLIGTTMGLAAIVRRFMAFTGCTLQEAIATATRVPARILGLGTHKGAIAAGMDADIVLLENDLAVHATFVGGREVYRAPA